MKSGKASGPTGVVVEMLRAGGKSCLESLTRIFNEMLFENKLPGEWKLSSLVPNYKGKGEPQNTNSYRGIKLMEHAFKLYETILNKKLGDIVDIDKKKLCLVQEQLKQCLFLRDRQKSISRKARSCFMYLLIWKKRLIEYRGN